MKHYPLGLLGHPLTHSLSPAIHRAALEAAGLAGDYALHPVPPLPEGAAALDRLTAALRRGEIHGLNVTIPHKRSLLDRVDCLGAEAEAAGAVNTLSMQGGLLVGDNTDIEGFRRDLARTLALPPGRALVLGAGGAARAAAAGLLQDGWTVSVAARRREEAEALADRMREIERRDRPNPEERTRSAPAPGIERILALPLVEASLAGLRPDLIVNATPVGMAPDAAGSPWPAEIPLPPGCAVYDLVYNPRQTPLLELARRQGAPSAGGLGMLVEQAALSFEIWTGIRPPLDHLYTAAETALLAMRKESG